MAYQAMLHSLEPVLPPEHFKTYLRGGIEALEGAPANALTTATIVALRGMTPEETPPSPPPLKVVR